MAEPFFGFGILFCEGSVFVQEAGEGIAVDPDLVISFFLRFIKDKLEPPVEVNGFNIVHIFRLAVAGMAHVADHITGSDHAALFKIQSIRKILPQMGIVIIALAVKTADANTPASVLIPAQGFHIAGFDSDDGRTDQINK